MSDTLHIEGSDSLTLLAIYVLRRTETRSFNHSCSGKAVSVTYSESVCSRNYLACNALAPYSHLWPVRLNNILPHYLINSTVFERERK